MRSTSLSRRDFVRSSATAIAAGASCSILIGCESDTSDSGLIPIDFLTILDPEGLTFAPELLGIAGGFFAEQGLDVRLQQTRGSAPAIQAIITGGAPLTRIEQIEGAVHLANRDVPIRNVGTVIKESSIRFVSSTAAPVREPSDFVGKLAGIPSQGGSTDKTLDLVVSSVGIDPATIERQVVGYSAGTFDLVQRGNISCYGVSIDVAKILQQQRDDVVVFNPGDFIAAGAQFYMVSTDGLVEHADVIRRYLAAVYAAIEFMIDDVDFEQTLARLRERYSFATLLNTEIAKASLSEYVRIWTAEGRENLLRTSEAAWRRGYEELVQAGLAESGRDPSAWFTNEFVPSR
jgi:NitT/TauT family transport system substrate-binding protein